MTSNSAWLATFLLALSLAADTFSVGLGVGAGWCGRRQIFRLSFHFGLFQALMPVAGWALGEMMSARLGVAAQYVAALVVGLLGARMLYDSFKPAREASCEGPDPTRGLSLVMLSLATSTDALGAGFSLALLGAGLILPCLIIGFTAAASTVTAMLLGRRIRAVFGKRAETAGSAVLLGLAVWILARAIG